MLTGLFPSNRRETGAWLCASGLEAEDEHTGGLEGDPQKHRTSQGVGARSSIPSELSAAPCVPQDTTIQLRLHFGVPHNPLIPYWTQSSTLNYRYLLNAFF